MHSDLIYPNRISEKSLGNNVKIKTSKPYEKKVCTEVSGSETRTKNLKKAQPNRNNFPNT